MYKGLTITGDNWLLKEVSAIKNVRYREVSLYCSMGRGSGVKGIISYVERTLYGLIVQLWFGGPYYKLINNGSFCLR